MDAVSTSPVMYERSPRRDCRLRAVLSFGDYNSRLMARVKNMSASGAALKLEDNHRDTRFEDGVRCTGGRALMILPAEKTCVEVEVVWERDGQVGMRFCKTFEPFEGRV